MRLNLDELAAPPHPNDLDFRLHLQTAGDAITAARTLHRQLMGELQEARRSTLSASKAVSLGEGNAKALPEQTQRTPEPVAAEVAPSAPPEVDRPPRQVSRRVTIRPR